MWSKTVILPSLMFASGLGVLSYNYLSGRSLLRDSWEQFHLVTQPLDYWESIWRKRPPTQIIACLTTIPSRLPYLELTLKSLLAQNWALQKIRLHLPAFSQRENAAYILPDNLKDREWLEVVTCHDYGPATKLIPAILELPDEQQILVVDDDMLYPADLSRTLLTYSQRYSNWVIGSSGWVVPGDLIDRPTTLWDNLAKRPPAPIKSTRVIQPYPVDVIQGYSGFLTRPSFYNHKQLIDYSGAPDACRWVDDVWLSARSLVPKGVFPASRYCFERWTMRKMMKTGSLGRKNRGDGDLLKRNNTIAIRYLKEYWLNHCSEGSLEEKPNPLPHS